MTVENIAFYKELIMSGRFELRVDEDTGRRYWWGGEDGWKDPTEVGEDGTLIVHVDSFQPGTVLVFTEPDQEQSSRTMDSGYYQGICDGCAQSLNECLCH